MRWEGQQESENVEDRRDEGGQGAGFPGGGGFNIPIPMGGQGGGGLVGVLVIVGLALLFGVDPRILMDGGGIQLPGGSRQIQAPTDRAPRTVTKEEEDLKRFVGAVLSFTEIVWTDQFRAQGKNYIKPKLVLFRGGVQSGCGYGQAQMGPFYCPNDRKIYIDLSFYEDLKTRFNAPGDFAQAYVIAHEVGHHIQNLTGVLGQTRQAQQAAPTPAARNALQVRVELQADCLAGVWAKNSDRISKILEPGDIEEALRAATAIGDDRLQRGRGRGVVVPDSFTHGTSEQRARWFKRGFDGGTIGACDTFTPQTV